MPDNAWSIYSYRGGLVSGHCRIEAASCAQVASQGGGAYACDGKYQALCIHVAVLVRLLA